MTRLKNLFILTSILFTQTLAAENITIGGSGADLATFQILADKYSQSHPGISINILPSIGSGGGIKAVKKGSIDLCLTSRAPKKKEQSDEIIFQQYAQTPFVFITHTGVITSNISIQDVLDIYSGEKTHWENTIQIKPVLRPSNDSDIQILRNKINGFDVAIEEAYKRRGLPIASTDQESLDYIAKLDGAIGTSTLSLVKTENRSVKTLKLDNIEGTPENIDNGSYKLFKKLYLCHKRTTSKELSGFIDFVKSGEGRHILKTTGHKTF